MTGTTEKPGSGQESGTFMPCSKRQHQPQAKSIIGWSAALEMSGPRRKGIFASRRGLADTG
jgi:hypothetical protein